MRSTLRRYEIQDGGHEAYCSRKMIENIYIAALTQPTAPEKDVCVTFTEEDIAAPPVAAMPKGEWLPMDTMPEEAIVLFHVEDTYVDYHEFYLCRKDKVHVRGIGTMTSYTPVGWLPASYLPPPPAALIQAEKE